MKRKINEMLAIGITGTAIFGSFFAADYGDAIWGNKDIWWTPMSMALSPNDTRQDFELYVKGELLQKHLERGTLIVVNQEGQSSPVIAKDVRVRFNNWNKIKASKLNNASLFAFVFGASFSLLIIGVFRLIKERKQQVNE